MKKAIFHWYTGPINVLRDILDQGYLISATPAAEYHDEHRQAIKETPLQSLVLETDSPVIYRQGSNPGYKSEPADVARTLQAVAILKDSYPIVFHRST